MNNLASLEIPVDLKERIERVAKERNEEPASFVAYAVDVVLDAEAAQIAEIRRRMQNPSRKYYTNEQAMAKLDSLRPSRRGLQPK